MYTKKRIFILTIILIAISILLSFSFANSKLKVGYDDEYPLGFKDVNGIPSGYVVEIFNKFAEKENYEIEYIYGTWSENLTKLKNDEIDVILNILKSEKRDEIFDFNENPLVIFWGKISVNSNYKVESILDLDGLKVGYMKGDYYAVEEAGIIEKAKEFELNIEFVSYDTYKDIFKAIEKNEVNAGVTNNGAANQIYDYKFIKETPINFAANGVKIATLNGENNDVLKKMDNYIEEIRNDKSSYYYERHDFWFNETLKNKYEMFYYEFKHEILWSIFLIILIIFYSRIRVYFKTKELKNGNGDLEKANYEIIKKYNEIKFAYKEVDVLVNRFEKLMNFISESMKSSNDKSEKVFLKELLKEAFDLVKEADYGFVFSYNKENELEVVDAINFKKINLVGIKRKELIRMPGSVTVIDDFITKLINNVERASSKEQIIEKMDISKESMVFIFQKKHKIFGGILLEIKKDSKKLFTEESKRIMIALKNIAESHLLNESYYEINEVFQKEIVFSMIEMLEIHDIYTKGHSENVANYSRDLAKYIGLSDKKVNEIYWAGLVHDTGKVLIDKSIINKKGKLTNEEYEIIKKHPEFGYKALNESEATKDMAKYVLYHHERIDGKGYPKGLKGEEIPFESKIIAIADSFDAMTSERTYKEIYSNEKALEEIKNNLGLQFDREMGLKFIEMLEKNQKTSDVKI
jgi:HD-GYP domain-containing protein (c-di-GMP phosphodiesterase class II)/ABC-type amino acid transport substrate-binding protein